MAYPAKRDEVKELRDKIKLHPTGAYLFWGEEEYLKRYCLDELRAVIKNEGMEDFNRTVIDFDREGTIKDIEDAVDSLPVMAEHKIIEVWGLDLTSLKKEDEKRLTDAVKNVAKDTIFVIFERLDELDLSTKKSKERKLIKDLSALMTVTEFSRQSEMKLLSWTDRIFKTAEVRISDLNISKMIKLCDFSMTRLKSDSEKLIAYCKRNALDTVPNEIIDLLVKPTAENEAFEFTDALIRRNKKEACTILENLKGQNVEAVIILSIIQKALNALSVVKSARGKLSDADISAVTGLFPWQIRNYLSASSNWTNDELSHSVRLAFLCDGDLKSTGVAPYVLLERLVVSIL
ncbi:MAG: DNA polymerase III subunit delta [Clostridia bacterium]|nr:DNA polymerase III subunit delta [Clostridia bacterium]